MIDITKDTVKDILLGSAIAGAISVIGSIVLLFLITAALYSIRPDGFQGMLSIFTSFQGVRFVIGFWGMFFTAFGVLPAILRIRYLIEKRSSKS